MSKEYENRAQNTNILQIPQGEVIRQIQKGTIINSEMNPGCCVLGISLIEDGFIAAHTQQGEIVRELTALAKLNGKSVTVFQGLVEGEISSLHESGQQLTPAQIKQAFRNRDRRHLTGLI